MQSQKVSAEDHGNLIVSSITPRVTPVRNSKRSGKIRSDASNTRERVFHWDIQTPRRELKKTTRCGVFNFLTKFEVFLNNR